MFQSNWLQENPMEIRFLFVTYEGIFNLSFHFHVYLITEGPHYCI